MEDSFIGDYDDSELEIAAEFLTNWIPFLTRGLCDGCSAALVDRIDSLRRDPAIPATPAAAAAAVDLPVAEDSGTRGNEHIEPTGWDSDPNPTPPLDPAPQPSYLPEPETPKVRMSWADMAQEEEELEEEGEEAKKTSGNEGEEEIKKKKMSVMSKEQKELIRFNNIKRKKDFICLERVKGKIVNILDGLELHTGIFSAGEQKKIVDLVYHLQEKGRNNQFGEHTYSEPRKWMRGKGRVTIQFGCCYNYAMKNGVPPGIIHSVIADPIPPLLKVMIKRLVRWHVLPTTCVPDSCIVNIYEPEDCIPPHIDSHDFVRPFCTVSFLSECNILFGPNLKTVGAGEFAGSIAIPLPVGSVLVLNGNGADVAQHCVPAVPAKRISITFRKMDESKHPDGFTPEPDLQNILWLPLPDDVSGTEFQHETGSGYRSKLFDVGRESSNMGNRSRMSSSREKPGSRPSFDYHPIHPYDSETTTMSSTHRDVNAVPSTSRDSTDRSKGSGGSLLGPVPFDPDLHETASSRDFAEGYTRRRSQQQMWMDNVPEDYTRRRSPRQAQMDEEVYSASRVQSQQKYKGEEQPVRRWQQDEGNGSWRGNREYNGRRVRMEKDRIVISREHEEGDPGAPRIRVQSLNNGRRRVQVSLSDN